MSAGTYLFLGSLLGGALGLLLGWMLGRRAPATDERLENELRQQLGQRNAEVNELRTELAEATRTKSVAEANNRASERLLLAQKEIKHRALDQAKVAQERILQDLRTTFKALSVDALRELQPHFIERVSETVGRLQEAAKGDLAQRQEAIATLVEPLKQQLETYQKRLQQSETSQADTLGKVKEQLEKLAQSNQTLASETQQFRMVLKSNQARGRWGEETLRRVVEAAGMSAHCDFTEQTQAGENRPDL